MSEVLVAPSVFGIAALPAGLLLGGVVLAAVLVRRLATSMESRSRKAFEDAVKTLPQFSVDVLRPPSLVEHDGRLYMKTIHSLMEEAHLPTVEQMRVSALLSLASGPYIVETPAVLEQPLAELFSAETAAEVGRARKVLAETARSGHRQAFTRGLTHACENAFRKTGFSNLEASPGRLGEIRVVGVDSQGRSLVAEIRQGKNGDPSLEAEVVGVRDGSCHEILDAFEKALVEQGVRYLPPSRRATGGICQLEAAKDFVRRQIERKTHSEPNTVVHAQDGRRRAQRLNQKRVQEVG